MSRLAVVGGNGFIGADLVSQATETGWEVLVIDPSPSRGGPTPRTSVSSVAVSITDADGLTRALTDFAPTATINLAAFGVGRDGLAHGARVDPGAGVDVNVRGVANVVRAAAAAGCGDVIWSSSSTVYGPAAGTTGPVPEHVELYPASLYGATKVGAEHVSRVLAAELGLRAVAVRLPLIYGAGRWYGGSQGPLVDFVAALARREPARLDAWTRPADWMHVHDAAACLLALARTPGATAPAYNVTGHRSSLHELGSALVDASGVTDAVVHATDLGAPDLPLMDTTRVRHDLDLRPSIATVAAGAERYLRDLAPDPDREFR